MASGKTTPYEIPYPLPSDPPNVSGDIQALAESVDDLLQATNGNLNDVTADVQDAITKANNATDVANAASASAATANQNAGTALTTANEAKTGVSDLKTTVEGLTQVVAGKFANPNPSSYTAHDLFYRYYPGLKQLYIFGSIAKSTAFTAKDVLFNIPSSLPVIETDIYNCASVVAFGTSSYNVGLSINPTTRNVSLPNANMPTGYNFMAITAALTTYGWN